MRLEIIQRTLDLHPCGGLFVWFGPPGSGKTTTARHLVEKTAQDLSLGKLTAFRASHVYYREVQPCYPSEIKETLRYVYQGILHTPLHTSIYLQSSTESIATLLVHKLRAEKIEMVLVEGSDYLSLGALVGLKIIHEAAQILGGIISLVFIGSEEFPNRVRNLPTIFPHVTAWFHFEETSKREGVRDISFY